MTDWTGKWISHLGDTERSRQRKGKGKREGDWEKQRRIARVSYNHIHFLKSRVNIRFHMPEFKVLTLKGREMYNIFSHVNWDALHLIIKKERERNPVSG